MDPLSQLQHDLQALLLGDPALSVVPVSTYKQYVVSAMQADDLGAWQVRVAGSIGVAIQVRMPAVRPVNPNVPGPQLAVEIAIRIFEDPVNNNTGLTAESVGLEVLRWLDGVRFEGVTEIEADPQNPALKPVYDYPDRFCYDAIFTGQLPMDYLSVRVQTPTLSDNGTGRVTLACGDGAATIYYTTDGTLATPGDATKAYSAPFQVSAGTTIRWFAWRAGQLPSTVQMAVVTD